MTEPMHPGDLTYRNQTVRLTDLAVTTDIIKGVTFENCTIIGPAVIALLGAGELRNSGFDGEFEAIIWPVADDRAVVVGAIALVDCIFVSCRFQRIGLAVPEAQMAQIREGFGIS